MSAPKPKHIHHDKPAFDSRTEPIIIRHESDDKIDEFVCSPPFPIVSRHSVGPDGQQIHEDFPQPETNTEAAVAAATAYREACSKAAEDTRALAENAANAFEARAERQRAEAERQQTTIDLLQQLVEAKQQPQAACGGPVTTVTTPQHGSATDAKASGGQSAIRGYLVQTLTALLDALGDDRPWDRVLLEPAHDDLEKIDLLWEHAGGERAVQVKSSQNQINKADAERWARELESHHGGADELELVLVGPCAESVVKLGQVGRVRIPAPVPLDPALMCEAAAHRLARFLESRQEVAGLAAQRERLVEALLGRLFCLSADSRWLTKEELAAELLSWSRQEASRLCPFPVSDVMNAATSAPLGAQQGQSLLQRLQTGPDNAILTQQELAFLTAWLHQPENRPTAVEGRDGNYRHRRFSLIRDYNKGLSKTRPTPPAPPEATGVATNAKADEFLYLANKLEEAKREINLAREQSTKPKHLYVRTRRAAVQAARAVASAVDAGFPEIWRGGEWTLWALRKPDDPARPPATITIGGLTAEMPGLAIGSGCHPDGTLRDDTAFALWKLHICAGLRSMRHELKADAGAFDFPRVKTDAQGRIIGRDGKPLTTIEKIDSESGEVVGWELSGPEARITDDYDDADLMEHLRCQAADWADACDVAADLIRKEARKSAACNEAVRLTGEIDEEAT